VEAAKRKRAEQQRVRAAFQKGMEVGLVWLVGLVGWFDWFG
jgi:hypothetical protein